MASTEKNNIGNAHIMKRCRVFM